MKRTSKHITDSDRNADEEMMETSQEKPNEQQSTTVARLICGKLRVFSNDALKKTVASYIDYETDAFDRIDAGPRYGLPIDMWTDGFEDYKFHPHEPWAYFRNGYSLDDDCVPIMICDDPYVPYEFEQKVSDKDIMLVYEFVKTNRDLLLRRADMKIGMVDYYKALKGLPVEESASDFNDPPQATELTPEQEKLEGIKRFVRNVLNEINRSDSDS